MHLKSTNGPIDVLVCPEAEDERSHSPFSSPSDYNPAIPSALGPSPDLEEATPTNTPPPQQEQQQQHPPDLGHHPHTPLPPHSQCMPLQADMNVTPQSHLSMSGSVVTSSRVNPSTVIDAPASELDISLSSAADVNGDDLEGLMDSYNCGALDGIDSSVLLPTSDMSMLSFSSLSPPLQDEDFCFAMETTEGIQDLFDLVA